MKLNKQQLLQLITAHEDQPLRFRDIAQILSLDKGRKALLRELLEALLDERALTMTRGGGYTLPGRGPGAAGEVIGKLSCHRDGYGFVTPDGEGEDIFIPARYLRENLHGDRVAVVVVGRGTAGKREGRIVRTLERGVTRVVGRFAVSDSGGSVIPTELRVSELHIPANVMGKARDGQLVVAEVTAYPSGRRKAIGKVVEVLGNPADPDVEVLAVVRKYDLPDTFSPAVLSEARAVAQELTPEDLEGRTDLRGMTTVTIDGETARDFDDAVAVVREERGIRLWVSIADVAHYVRPGSPLDTEAYLRGTSVYFPDRCLPMLPEELSNGICSLNPHVDRLAMTAELLINQQGEVLESAFYPSVINSVARLTYTIVKGIVVDGDPDLSAEHGQLVADLQLMKELALQLSAKRQARGSIDFDLPEPQIILDLQGGTEAIIRAERNLAHRIIEEFMLAANEAVAGSLEKRGVPTLYRVHEAPDPAKLAEVREFFGSLGYVLAAGPDGVEPEGLQQLLAQASGKPEERLINQVLLRSMKQARYAAENLGHFGLAAACYTHFTSPIRRYPDLVVHRILKQVLAGKLKKRVSDELAATMPAVADQCSSRERVAMEAERELVELKKVQFMVDKLGETFDGVINGVTTFGLFVELTEFFVEGMVHISTLPQDFYRYLEKEHTLVGERKGSRFRIGDQVRVVVANVSPERRQIEFVLEGTAVASITGEPANEGIDYARRPVTGKKPKGWREGRPSPAGKEQPKGKGRGRKGRPRK